MSPRAGQQNQNNSQQVRSRIGPNIKSCKSPDPDEIQVIEETKPIPIQTTRFHEQPARHDDLLVNSVHDRNARSSPLARFCKLDDIDLIADSVESGEEGYDDGFGGDEHVRGRGRRTKPLFRPRQMSPPRPQPHRPYRSGLDHQQDPYSPDHYRPIVVGIESDSRDDVQYQDTGEGGRIHAKPSRFSQRKPDVLDLEAPVFDFEESSQLSTTSELEPKSEPSFDGPYFWRPATHMYTYSGAFQPVDTSTGPTSHAPQEGREADYAVAQRKRHRLGHHRTVSELYLSPTSCAGVADSRATRRRATVGSQESYRLPPFARRENLPA